LGSKYVDSAGRTYEDLGELVGAVVQTAKMKIASTTLTKGQSVLQYLGGIPADGIRVVGGAVDVTIVQEGSGTLALSIGTPADPDRFAEFDNSDAGYDASFVEDFTDADASLIDPIIESTDITANSPAVISVKLEERNDVTGDSVVVSGFVYLDYVQLGAVSARQVRKADGNVDTDRT
jgi:hypothetical protein